MHLSLELLDAETGVEIEGVVFSIIRAAPAVGEEICYREASDADPFGDDGARTFVVNRVRHNLLRHLLDEGRAAEFHTVEVFVTETTAR